MKSVLQFEIKDNGVLMLFPSEITYKEKLLQILHKCQDKTNSYCSIDIERPYKPRTTGEGSQNNLFWSIATVIANEIGEDIREVEKDLKMKAISKGYPYDVSKITSEPNPWSMTKINTIQMSYLIDTAYEVCGFLGITLPPELIREEPKSKVKQEIEEEIENAFNYSGDIF